MSEGDVQNRDTPIEVLPARELVSKHVASGRSFRHLRLLASEMIVRIKYPQFADLRVSTREVLGDGLHVVCRSDIA